MNVNTLIQTLILGLLPLISSGQSILGFHEAQDDARGDWISFSLRGKTIWVNPDVSVTVTKATFAELRYAASPASVVESMSHPCLHLTFTEQDRARFADLTTRATGRRIAILHRGELLAAPGVSVPVSSGRVIIHGIQDQATARGIVAALTTPH